MMRGKIIIKNRLHRLIEGATMIEKYGTFSWTPHGIIIMNNVNFD